MPLFVIRARTTDPDVVAQLQLPELRSITKVDSFDTRYEMDVYDDHYRKTQRLAGMLASCDAQDRCHLTQSYQRSINTLGLASNHPQLSAVSNGTMSIKNTIVSTKMRMLMEQFGKRPTKSSIVTSRSVCMLRILESLRMCFWRPCLSEFNGSFAGDSHSVSNYIGM